MSANLIIHRAADEIGGNCIEIGNGKKRILFDFGMPISSAKDNKTAAAYRLEIEGAYYDQPVGIDAVFLTHAHTDHYGMLGELNPKIPVYASQTTVNLLQNISPLYGVSLSHLNFVVIYPGQTIKNGSISVRPLAVDHSVPQSFAYLIEADGKIILYTGDIRAHGKCGYLTSRLVCSARPDYLIMEGTTLSRPERNFKTEEELQFMFEKIFSSGGIPIVSFSPLNLDRFVSIYKAARKLKKTLVIDPYTCFVLEQFRHLGKNIPQWNWHGIRVYFAANSTTHRLGSHIFNYKSRKITLDNILSNPKEFIIKDNSSIRRSLLKRTADIHLIHSSWAGYLEEADNAFKQDAIAHNLPIAVLHTSGHGDYGTLLKFVQKLSPRLLIPVHTECADKYNQLFNVQVRVLKNGANFSL